MALLCFLLDLRSIPPPLLRNLKQHLLQLANLYAVCHKPCRKDSMPALRDLIALCYLHGSRNASPSCELKIAYRPTDRFSLRDLHHAVNSLPMDSYLPELNDSFSVDGIYPELLLGDMLNDTALYTWCGEDIVKKVVCITSFVYASAEALRKSLMGAAEKCVTMEFVVLEQSDLSLNPNVIEKIDVFVNSISDLENCMLRRYCPDTWVLSGLVKRWLQEIRCDVEEVLHAVLHFKSNLLGNINQISCNLFASFNQIIDGIAGCQACRCHGFPINKVMNCNAKTACSFTGRELGTSDIVDNAAKVGEGTLLFLPSFDGCQKFQHISGPITLNVIERTSLASLNEGFIMGQSYMLTPHEVEAAIDETDKSELNSQLFRALCEALFISDQGLICSSTCNIETMHAGAFQCFYILQSSDRGLMLLRKLAGSEEILPIPDTNQSTDLVVPLSMKNCVEDSLSKLELRDYNPLEHERGLHLKLNSLVKESLQIGSLVPPRARRSSKEKSPLQQGSSQATKEESNANRKNGENSLCSITKNWEQLLVIDDELTCLDAPSCTSKSVFHSSAFLAESKPLDEKTSRILERLETPKQQKTRIATSPILSSSLITGSTRKPLLPLDSNSSQPMKPNFQRLKRKQR